MTTTLASALLYDLSHRIEMAKKGIINPTPLVLERAKQIVEALKTLEPNDQLEFKIADKFKTKNHWRVLRTGQEIEALTN